MLEISFFKLFYIKSTHSFMLASQIVNLIHRCKVQESQRGITSVIINPKRLKVETYDWQGCRHLTILLSGDLFHTFCDMGNIMLIKSSRIDKD